ncbi:hypothetical protein GW17_00034243 [Ensete ventricosum]|nr:hypothetical protein GW17_00034243 [Ensete ventricosum]RZS14672.1 hypothetical protein BHM03_00046408 [Ensete ventricosum]
MGGVTLSFYRFGEFSRICRHGERLLTGRATRPSARFGSRINLKNTFACDPSEHRRKRQSAGGRDRMLWLGPLNPISHIGVNRKSRGNPFPTLVPRTTGPTCSPASLSPLGWLIAGL